MSHGVGDPWWTSEGGRSRVTWRCVYLCVGGGGGGAGARPRQVFLWQARRSGGRDGCWRLPSSRPPSLVLVQRREGNPVFFSFFQSVSTPCSLWGHARSSSSSPGYGGMYDGRYGEYRACICLCVFSLGGRDIKHWWGWFVLLDAREWVSRRVFFSSAVLLSKGGGGGGAGKRSFGFGQF